jgi:hypothetical protein
MQHDEGDVERLRGEIEALCAFITAELEDSGRSSAALAAAVELRRARLERLAGLEDAPA